MKLFINGYKIYDDEDGEYDYNDDDEEEGEDADADADVTMTMTTVTAKMMGVSDTMLSPIKFKLDPTYHRQKQ